jgi:hypothetical protein
MLDYPITRGVPSLYKVLVVCGFAVGVNAAAANASSLAEYYRSMFTMKFCNMTAGAEVSVDAADAETDVDQSIRLPIDQQYIDMEATSEDVAPLFEQLNTEYIADPAAFCEQNMPATQEIVEENQ